MSKIWIAFSGKANLKNVEKGLETLLKDFPNSEFYCCFLTKEMVTKANINPGLVDLLERKLGDKLTWMLKDYHSLDEVKPHLDELRTKCAKICDKLCILDSDIAKGVAKEIEIMSGHDKVVLM